MKVAVLLANGFEEIEAISIIDLLRRAKIEVSTFSINKNSEAQGVHKIKVITDQCYDEDEIKKFDGLFLPGGGEGVLILSAESKILDLVKYFAANDKYIISICAAAFVLEMAEVIDGRNIACYPSWEDKIKSANIVREKVVVDDKIITSRGAGTAIDLGLKLIEIFCGKEDSDKIRSQIIY